MLKLKKLQIIAQQNSFTQISQKEMEEIWGTGATYSVDSRGRITLITDSNGFSYDVVRAGTATHSVSGSLVVSSYTYEWNKVGSQIERGDYDLFKFLADHTDVEWGAMYSGGINPSGSTECFLQTSHGRTSCHISYDVKAGYDTFVHSHPLDGDAGATSDDTDTKDAITGCEGNTITNFGIYHTNTHTVSTF